MGFNVTVTPVVQEVDISASVQAYEVEIIVNSDIKKYADEAKASADQAEASAISADNSADSASASATSATASANSASSSASSASSSASTATTQAGIATTKANEASQSATNALASEQASAISEANALASEQASAQSEANALSSEQNALASEQASALSASNALASENSASASASTATTQAGISTTQAGIATTQASNALASANAAALSASQASQVGTSTILSGFSVGANSTIASTDSILQAFNKTQGQINARVSGTGTSGQVSFWNGTTSQTGDAGLTWNNTTKTLDIGSGGTARKMFLTSSGSLGANYIDFVNTTGRQGYIGYGNSIDDDFIILQNKNSPIRFATNALTRWSILATGILQSTGTQTIQTSTGLLSLQANGGNIGINTTTDAGFRLDVAGTTRLNGLQTFQGTTASDTAPLGSELATTGSGTNWTGTGFATGYTHAVGSTASLTTSTPAVNGTYYQIAYTITGRTAGSITINYGGTSTASITATGATGPLATSTANLEIVPTTDFDGTVVLSLRSIGTSSATTTFTDSGGTNRIQIRANSSANNTLVGNSAGRRITSGTGNSFFGASAGINNTTGTNNSFFGRDAGFNNTIGGSNSFFGVNSGVNNLTGISNSFFGVSSGNANTTGTSNSFFGVNAGFNNTTGSTNSFFGVSSGNANTTGTNNSFFGVNSGLNNTTGSFNIFIGLDAGRRISGGGNLTVSTNSVFVGVDTRANADSETNQTVIGYQAIGLGSNTTVIGNSSTTFGRWWGNLLLGTSTNSGFTLDVAGSTRIVPPANTTGLTLSGYSLTGSSAVPAVDISGTWNTTGTPTLILANVTNTASNASSRLIDLQVGTVSRFRVLANGYVNFGTSVRVYSSSSTSGGDVDVNGEFLTLNSRTTSTETGASTGFVYLNGPNASATSGIQNAFLVSKSFTPTSGNASYNSIISQPGINQTGGANGITRGLYVNPTLTSASDWRSIEWSNNTGRGLWGIGTADNAIAGAMHIGSATVPNAVAQLEVSSTTKGFLPPRMTTAQRDLIAAVAGLVIYNTTTNKHQGHNGTAWQDFY